MAPAPSQPAPVPAPVTAAAEGKIAFSRRTHASRKLATETVTPTLGDFAAFQRGRLIAQGYRIPKKAIQALNELFVKAVADELLAGRHVCLTEFGTFFLISRTVRAARDKGGRLARVKFIPAVRLKRDVAERVRA